MKHMGLIALVLGVSAVAATGIDIAVPSFTIDVNDPNKSFTVPVQFDSSFDNLDSYALTIALVGRSGATGLTYYGVTEAATNYIFSSSDGVQSYSNGHDPNYWLFADDGVDGAAQDISPGTYNLYTATIDVGTVTEGDVFDLVVDANANYTGFWDEQFNKTVPMWTNGVITIVPEPVSLSLLLIGGLAAAAARRRKR